MIDRFLCWLGKCRACVTTDDDTGVWGECVRCHRKHGFVSRAELRAYADRFVPPAKPGAPAITINEHAHGDDRHG